MVDFQSRTTRREPGEEDEDEPESEQEETGADEEESETESADAVDVEERTGGDGVEGLGVAIVSIGPDRSVEDDPAGSTIIDEIEAAGDTVVTREVLNPSFDTIQRRVGTLVDRGDVEAVVTAGGTGVEPSDVTVDAIRSLFDKELPGFGELFRVLCHDRSGTAVVRTRATAGLVDDVPVFCLPGEVSMARLGVAEIVVEQAEPLVQDATREEA